MQFIDSPFKNSLPVKKGRKFAVKFLDLLVLAIVTIFLFVIADAVGNATPAYKEKSKRAGELQNELYSMALGAKLMAKKDNAYLSLNEESDLQIKKAVKASLLKNGKKESEISGIYIIVEAANSSNDQLFYYLNTFTNSHLDSFDDARQANEPSKYLEIMPNCTEFYEKSDGYYYLTFDAATKIDNYYRDSSYSLGSEIFNKVKEGYKTGLSSSIDDFCNHYIPYKTAYSNYLGVRDSIYWIKIPELLAAYLAAAVLTFFVFPLSLKEKATLPAKVMKIAVIRRDGNIPKFYNLLGKTAINFLEMPICMAVTILVFYGSGGVDLLMAPLFLNVSFLGIAVFSLAAMLIGYFSCFIFRKTNSTLSEAASGLYEGEKEEQEAKRNVIE
ncbi:MAG: RDD family protein [Bacilli bacterium]|nr:RDD family protein [Bacilli bacterium]